jgi:hypothetical protein
MLWNADHDRLSTILIYQRIYSIRPIGLDRRKSIKSADLTLRRRVASSRRIAARFRLWPCFQTPTFGRVRKARLMDNVDLIPANKALYRR